MSAPIKSSNTNRPKKASELDVYIGGRLRMWRRTMDVDANLLAARVGITYQQLQKYEKGMNRISAARLYAISQEINVPIEYFFREVLASPLPQTAGDGKASVDNRVLIATELGPDLLKCFVSIKNSGVRKAVLALVRSIIPCRVGVEPTS